jgi:uncharacterized delta-60 repeat protein
MNSDQEVQMKKSIMLVSFILVFVFSCIVPVFAQHVDTAWVRRYNGPRNYHDYATAMTIDDSGYVYVTGRSEGTGGVGKYYDFATIKYRPDGDTAWIRRFNGPGNIDEKAFAIALDQEGCVYVTGYCDGNDYLPGDYATIKYYPNGDTAWVRTYDGPGNGRDGAYSLAVDDEGNVYVTGESYGGTATYFDYATIKYYPDGDTAWVRRYDGPGNEFDKAVAVVVDASGNVYVTGKSHRYHTYPHEPDIATLKYDPDGNLLWVNRYSGPVAFGDDVASAMALDSSGYVYVTGSSWGSGTHGDWITIKLNSNGDTLWTRRFNGSGGGYDRSGAITVDPSGLIYVTGSCCGSISTPKDYATIKYYPNGDTAWVRIYDWPDSYFDEEHACAIALDTLGNVYVTGRSDGSEEYLGFDYSTLKYNATGNLVWAMRYEGPSNGHDKATAIAIDDFGNVYVTGQSQGDGTSSDYATLKYFQYANNAPREFSLLWPPRKAFTPRAILFKWEEAPDPDPGDQVTYDLYISTSYHFPLDSTLVYQALSANEHRVTLDRGTYFWKVRARDIWEAETWCDQLSYFMVTGLQYLTIGDLNKDRLVNVGDVVFAVNYLYRFGPAPNSLVVADCNCDGDFGPGDVVYLINYLFRSGPPPGC